MKMKYALMTTPDGLFQTAWRRAQGLSLNMFGWEQTWYGATIRNISSVGTHVLHYTATLPAHYAYPDLLDAILIEQGWEVKARFRANGGAWTYIKHAFPEGTEFSMPADWDG